MSPAGDKSPTTLAITGNLTIDTNAGRLFLDADGSSITVAAEKLRTALHAARVIRRSGIARLLQTSPPAIRQAAASPVSVIVRGNRIASGASNDPTGFKVHPAAAVKAALRIHGDAGRPNSP